MPISITQIAIRLLGRGYPLHLPLQEWAIFWLIPEHQSRQSWRFLPTISFIRVGTNIRANLRYQR
ncbi:MAG: hypothetical protein ACTH1W_12730, partial [Advenella sp.]